MTRLRVAVIGVVLVGFFVAAGFLIFSDRSGGAQNVILNVTVTDAKSMQPSHLSAHQNDTVIINVASDTNGELHLHGYDIGIEVKAGQTVTQTFKADKTGQFDIEWESTSAPLGELVVT